jgi:hypothetical protein
MCCTKYQVARARYNGKGMAAGINRAEGYTAVICRSLFIIVLKITITFQGGCTLHPTVIRITGLLLWLWQRP